MDSNSPRKDDVSTGPENGTPEDIQDQENSGASWWFRYRWVLFRMSLYLLVPVFLLILVSSCFFNMPGESLKPPLPELTSREKQLQSMARRHVRTLAGTIGDRSVQSYEQLEESKQYIVDELEKAGYSPWLQTYMAEGLEVSNVVAERTGSEKPDNLLIVGAHYDTAGNPGADDNASGVAGLLCLANMLSDAEPGITIRFVAFVNEEPPFYRTRKMGSRVYAKKLASEEVKVRGMISLEMIGYYSAEAGSQRYPAKLMNFIYPDRGNFIAFVSNGSSRGFLFPIVKEFRKHATIPSLGAAMPFGAGGASMSDNASFWREGMPALMVTDTAMMRNPHYHRQTDTPETLDFGRMARVIFGLGQALRFYVNSKKKK